MRIQDSDTQMLGIMQYSYRLNLLESVTIKINLNITFDLF